jgi:pimeloyl-ACP methyl ester carboxylesterase
VGTRARALRLGALQVECLGPDDGPLVLGVPGLSANLRAFDLLAERCAAMGQRFVALDLRGRGLSQDTGQGTYGWAKHAQDVMRVAMLLDAPRYSIVGWSMGAYVAMEVALQAPGSLDRVVLVDAVGPVDQAVETVVRASAERLGGVYPSPRAYLDLVRGLGTIEPWSEFWDAYFLYELMELKEGGVRPRTSQSAVLEDLEYGARHDATLLWPHLAMSVLVLRAMRPMHPRLGGHVIAPELLARFKTEVPHAETVEVPANHYTIVAHPHATEAIARFLSA